MVFKTIALNRSATLPSVLRPKMCWAQKWRKNPVAPKAFPLSFQTVDANSHSKFQDWSLKPLDHPSMVIFQPSGCAFYDLSKCLRR